MSCVSTDHIPQEDIECLETKLRNNVIYQNHSMILYQISKQWIFHSYILRKDMEWSDMMKMMKNTIQTVFKNKIIILREYPKDTRIRLKEDWDSIYRFIQENHVVPGKKIYQSLCFWNLTFCKTNRSIYELFAEMVNCFNHMNLNHNEQSISWKPYYRRSKKEISNESEGQFFLWILEYFLMLLDISIENEEKMVAIDTSINGGNNILHILDIIFYFHDLEKEERIEYFVDKIIQFPMKDLFGKEGFIYEPIDYRRHYQDIEDRCKRIIDQLIEKEDLSYSFDQIRIWTTLSRELKCIDQMKFTYYIPSIWIDQFDLITRSIFDKKRVTSIDYIMIYYRVQMILWMISKINFL